MNQRYYEMATQQDLASWMKSCISTPYTSTADAYTQAFNPYSPDIAITVNGSSTTRDEYIQSVQQKTAAMAGASFDWGQVLVVPDDPSLPNEVLCELSYEPIKKLTLFFDRAD